MALYFFYGKLDLLDVNLMNQNEIDQYVDFIKKTYIMTKLFI